MSDPPTSEQHPTESRPVFAYTDRLTLFCGKCLAAQAVVRPFGGTYRFTHFCPGGFHLTERPDA